MNRNYFQVTKFIASVHISLYYFLSPNSHDYSIISISPIEIFHLFYAFSLLCPVEFDELFPLPYFFQQF